MLEVGGFDVDGGLEMTKFQVNINIQKRDLGRAVMPSEFVIIPAVEAFKELGERARTMRPKELNIIDKMLPEA